MGEGVDLRIVGYVFSSSFRSRSSHQRPQNQTTEPPRLPVCFPQCVQCNRAEYAYYDYCCSSSTHAYRHLVARQPGPVIDPWNPCARVRVRGLHACVCGTT